MTCVYTVEYRASREEKRDSPRYSAGDTFFFPDKQAISAILFYAGEGNLERMKAMIYKYDLWVSSGKIADYDQRTPLHLAAAEGCYAVASWLISQGAIVNAVDRFGGTPLDDAIRHGMAIDHLRL